MILPNKHIDVQNSILGVGATLLKLLGEETTVSSLWNRAKMLPNVKGFDRYTLGLDLLFVVGAVKFENGLLKKIHQ